MGRHLHFNRFSGISGDMVRVFLQDESVLEVRRAEHVMQIEINLDDLNHQTYEHVMERLFDVGAMDVALIPVAMKKSRPGVALSCLARQERIDAILEEAMAAYRQSLDKHKPASQRGRA